MLKMYVEPESPNEGACLISRTEIAKRGGVFKIYLEPESPNEGPCSRFMLNRNRQMRGRV